MPSVVVKSGIAYATGGVEGRTVAIRIGGKGDVSETHVLWTSRESSYISTPVFYEDYLYWINDKSTAVCMRASDGKLMHKRTVPLEQTGDRIFVASPVLIGKHLLAVSRRQGAFVFEAVPGLPLLGIHQFASDGSNFTPPRDQ